MIADNEGLFAELVITLLKNGRKRSALGLNALECIRSKYSWDANLKGLLDIINEPVGRQAERAGNYGAKSS